MPADLHIQRITTGDFQTHTYLVAYGELCWIIDPGFGVDQVLEQIKHGGWTLTDIVLTHGHVDHIAGVQAVHDAYPSAGILIHRAEERFLLDPALNLSIALDRPVVAPPATRLLDHGDVLDLAGLAFHVRHTPGHSPGGVAFYQPDHKLAISGDALFASGIGRFDFPTSDGATLIRSIREQLLTLPDDTRILPGHGPETTVGQERLTNPYLTGDQPVLA
ncbi:MAG: MBL fold metallo-hydrolase [Planctomycetota bacterium]